jgi:hypothetical protein
MMTTLMIFSSLMLPLDYYLMVLSFIVFAVAIIIFQQRSKFLTLLKPICYLLIFQVGGIYFLSITGDVFWVFLFINLMWTPLAVDDYFNKSVTFWPFLLIILLSVVVLYFFGIVTLTVLLFVAILLLIFRILVLFLEKMVGYQLVGGADYLAAFVFISSLELYLVGYWVILFSLLGILHSLRATSLKVAVPLIPFMLAAWCLVFSLSN